MAIEHAEFVAQALGCRKVEILGGLVELWQFSWKRREDIHQLSVLAAWFNCDPQKTLEALDAFGFAEDLKNGTFRVKGSERYLRIRNLRSEAGRKGGQKRAENAAKSASSTIQASAKQVPSKSLAIASNDEKQSKNETEDESNSKQVLSKSLASAKQVLSKSLEGAKQLPGNTEHRSQNTEHRSENIKDLVASKSEATSETATAAPKAKKQKKSKTPEDEARRKSLITALEASFLNATGSPYTWSGGRDFTALKSLLNQHPDSLILERWELGLKASGFLQVSNIGQLFSKFNDLSRLQSVPQTASPDVYDPEKQRARLATQLAEFEPLKMFQKAKEKRLGKINVDT